MYTLSISLTASLTVNIFFGLDKPYNKTFAKLLQYSDIGKVIKIATKSLPMFFTAAMLSL